MKQNWVMQVLVTSKLVLWMDTLARLGRRLVKDFLQLLHPQMVRMQGTE